MSSTEFSFLWLCRKGLLGRISSVSLYTLRSFMPWWDKERQNIKTLLLSCCTHSGRSCLGETTKDRTSKHYFCLIVHAQVIHVLVGQQKINHQNITTSTPNISAPLLSTILHKYHKLTNSTIFRIRNHFYNFVQLKSVPLISCVFWIIFQNVGSQLCFRFLCSTHSMKN